MRDISMYEAFDIIVEAVQRFFKTAGFTKAIIGESGGIDSAVCSCLLVKALGKENVIGVRLPTKFTSEASMDLGQRLMKNLEMTMQHTVYIQEPVTSLDKTLMLNTGISLEGVAYENLQARTRMVVLMGLANHYNALLIDTGNHTENWLGYATLYGDLAGAICPLSELTKIEVYGMANFINEHWPRPDSAFGHYPIPTGILTRKPSAELADDQVDPFDYEEYSPLVWHLAQTWETANNSWAGQRGIIIHNLTHKFPEDDVINAMSLIEKSQFKRDLAPPGIVI